VLLKGDKSITAASVNLRIKFNFTSFEYAAGFEMQIFKHPKETTLY